MLKILVSGVGGTKNYLNKTLYTYLLKVVSSFSSFSGHCESGLSKTKLQEVDIELI